MMQERVVLSRAAAHSYQITGTNNIIRKINYPKAAIELLDKARGCLPLMSAWVLATTLAAVVAAE